MRIKFVLAVSLVACNQPALLGSAPDAHRGGSDEPPPIADAAVDAPVAIDAPAAVVGCATAPVIAGSGAVTSWSRLTGDVTVGYFGDGSYTVDVTSFIKTWDPIVPTAAWPGRYGQIADIPLAIDKYVSAAFTVPVGYFETQTAPIDGEYAVGESGFSAAVSMTISEHCGDFGQLEPTTVVPGCSKNHLPADGALIWYGTPSETNCVLDEGKTYYLNIINADIATFPATTTLRSQYCVDGVCSTPIANGPGTWSNPGA